MLEETTVPETIVDDSILKQHRDTTTTTKNGLLNQHPNNSVLGSSEGCNDSEITANKKRSIETVYETKEGHQRIVVRRQDNATTSTGDNVVIEEEQGDSGIINSTTITTSTSSTSTSSSEYDYDDSGAIMEDIDDTNYLQQQIDMAATAMELDNKKQKSSTTAAEKAVATTPPRDEPILIEYRTKRGEISTFDISEAACRKFGFYYMDRCHTPNGPATVIGVRGGWLWFHIDGDPGCSYWDSCHSYTDHINNGFALIPPVVELKEGMYRLKEITYLGRKTFIVMQNENGPCPLVAISNVLLLRNNIEITGERHPPTYVTVDDLIKKILDYIMKTYPEPTPDTEEHTQWKETIDRIQEYLPRLQWGLAVNIRFTGVEDFENTPECIIFKQLNIKLLHGWLVEQETEAAQVIGKSTYNDLVDILVQQDVLQKRDRGDAVTNTVSDSDSNSNSNTPSRGIPIIGSPGNASTSSASAAHLSASPHRLSLAQRLSASPAKETSTEAVVDEEKLLREGDIIKAWLDETSTQLTMYGISSLQKNVKEEQLCVFFRNNHFSTLTLHQGSLYLLVTDIGYEKEKTIVWEKMDTITGASTFFSGEFQDSEKAKFDLEVAKFNPDHVAMLLDMGYSHEQVIMGLKHSRGSLDSAVDYILNHIY
eukprot:GEZU01002653.1.p1 GENE.GEZU01002653.1~~GEZU01002653.1.p1  ORF type:complete len:666 (-),score=185.23 GEZU01002653.1:313-2268(-)